MHPNIRWSASKDVHTGEQEHATRACATGELARCITSPLSLVVFLVIKREARGAWVESRLLENGEFGVLHLKSHA